MRGPAGLEIPQHHAIAAVQERQQLLADTLDVILHLEAVDAS
jgi:hypothetical protein